MDLKQFLKDNGTNNEIEILKYIYKYFVMTPYGLFYRSNTKQRCRRDPATNNMLIEHIPIRKYRNLWENHAKNHIAQIDFFNQKGDFFDENGWRRVVNLWCGFLIEPSNKPDIQVFEDVTPWLFNLKFCWCLDDNDLFCDLVQHFCSIFRNPTQRTQKNIHIQTNKRNWLASDCWDTIFKPIQEIMSPHYHEIFTNAIEDENQAKENWSWARSSILVVRSNFIDANAGFKLLESDTFDVRSEGDNNYTIRNFMNLFIVNNNNKNFKSKFENVYLNLNDDFFHKRALDHRFLNSYFDPISKTPPASLLQFLLTCSPEFVQDIKFQQGQKGVPDLSSAQTVGDKFLEYFDSALERKKPRLN